MEKSPDKTKQIYFFKEYNKVLNRFALSHLKIKELRRPRTLLYCSIPKAKIKELRRQRTKFNTFHSSLVGFRKGHSLTLALSEFLESTLSSFDKENEVCAVLLDLSKAFYCVDRAIL